MVLALLVAGVSDAVGLAVEPLPPVQWGVDIATAVALILILGFDWRLVPALIAEAIPGVGLLPLWILVVLWVVKARRGEASYDRPGL